MLSGFYSLNVNAESDDTEMSQEELALSDDNVHYLVQIIENSKAYPVMLEMNYFDATSHRRNVRRRVTRDTLNELGRFSVNALSEGFSNAVAYNKINWPTESVVGRYTISPDNIAIKALNGGPFELILFYHDGKG